jgi:hypothetical protein
MVMGERGMHDMTEMEMPLPDNTAADDDRHRPFRRRGHGRHVQRRQGPQGPEARRLQGPGLVRAPAGTVAYEFTGALADPARFKADSSPGPGSMPSDGQAR